MNAPIAGITLLDDVRQRFKAVTGMDNLILPREEAFCRFTVDGRGNFVVPDARLDDRFADHPLVLGPPGIAAYAGVSLQLTSGEEVGALCVLDTVARDFGENEVMLLEILASHVVTQIRLEEVLKLQASDVESLRAVRAELRHTALHDGLTGLSNRQGIITALERLQTGEKRESQQQATADTGVAVAYIDLDDFSRVNEYLGHAMGDQVLVNIADRLHMTCGPNRIIGRIGGDEFIVVMPGTSRHQAEAEASDWLRVLSEPMTLVGHTLHIDASIGLAHAISLDHVLHIIDHADRATGVAKETGGSDVSVWSAPRFEQDATRDRELKRFVRSTVPLDADSEGPPALAMHYQPILDLSTGRLERQEALLRWNVPAPAGTTVEAFVAMAEQLDLIHPIGEMALQSACGDAAAWQAEDPGVGVAVNISPLQVRPDLIPMVSSALKTSGLKPWMLTLEVTESNLLDQNSKSLAVVEELYDLGVRLALDDFGTGYASMSMLCALPLHELKIDRQFSMNATPAKRKVVRAAVELGHSLGLCVVAEGIETPDDLGRLTDLGCDLGQGFLFGRPADRDNMHHQRDLAARR